MAGAMGSYGNYRTVDIETASQGKLVVMLFNGAIQRAGQARDAIERKNPAEAHKHLVRAQDIISELRSSLDMSYGEVVQAIDRTYEYFLHRLLEANLRKDPAIIDEVIPLIEDMRDTWQEAFEKEESNRPVMAAPPKRDFQGASLVNMRG
jgi:flagellar protein FliS